MKKSNMCDLSMQTFGRLWVSFPAGSRKGDMHFYCMCICNKLTVVLGKHLKSGQTTSCGCYRREKNTERIRQLNLSHGHSGSSHISKSPEYSSWTAMRQRCSDSTRENYRYYGGRGISVCERWKKFVNFLADMGTRPAGTSIDRINPDENYCLENCRWADRKTQANNTRRSLRKAA